MNKHRLNKVRLLAAAMLLLLAGLLSACGGAATNSASGNKPSEAPASAQTAESGGETITYSAANGEIKVPKHPKRVVILATSYVGDFLALGIKPVGIPQLAIAASGLRQNDGQRRQSERMDCLLG